MTYDGMSLFNNITVDRKLSIDLMKLVVDLSGITSEKNTYIDPDLYLICQKNIVLRIVLQKRG